MAGQGGRKGTSGGGAKRPGGSARKSGGAVGSGGRGSRSGGGNASANIVPPPKPRPPGTRPAAPKHKGKQGSSDSQMMMRAGEEAPVELDAPAPPPPKGGGT